MQQQRLSDLKKTLQRELKVQTLPNDDTRSGVEKATSPPTLAPNLFPGHVELASMTNGNSKNSITSSTRQLERSFTVRPSLNNNRSRSPLSLQANDQEGGLSLWQDTNFEYLKHVVLKFVLSGEHEVCICN